MEKQELKLKRAGNMMLAARSFKVKVDGELIGKIDSGTEQIIDITNAKILTIEVMHYVSKPYNLEQLHSSNLSCLKIKINEFSILSFFLMCLVVLIAFILRKDGQVFNDSVMMYGAPMVLTSLYYMTFGKNKVILIKRA